MLHFLTKQTFQIKTVTSRFCVFEIGYIQRRVLIDSDRRNQIGPVKKLFGVKKIEVMVE
jgi:hypothetical protein